MKISLLDFKKYVDSSLKSAKFILRSDDQDKENELSTLFFLSVKFDRVCIYSNPNTIELSSNNSKLYIINIISIELFDTILGKAIKVSHYNYDKQKNLSFVFLIEY